jgi:N utilization substance protein B
MSKRRHARERVLQALYAVQLGGGSAEHAIQTIVRPKLSDDPGILRFAEQLVAECVAHRDEAIRVIEEHTTNWDLERIAVVDKTLLWIAIVEILYFPDIPPKVTINEIIEIAKRFSTSRSGSFINGVLDAALADLSEKGRVKKKGRGLVGFDKEDASTQD